MSTKRSKSGLGSTPLGNKPLGMFTDPKENEQTTAKKEQKPVVPTGRPTENKTATNRKKKAQSIPKFLVGVEDGEKEAVGLQITTDVNDWLDKVVKRSRRKHGKKLPKQVIIQAGVELLRAMSVQWDDIGNIDELRAELANLTAIGKGRSA